MTQATTQSRQQGRHGIATHLAMTALTFAAIGIFVLWHARQPGGDDMTAPVTSSTAQSRFPADDIDPLRGVRPGLARSAPLSGLVIYIAASEEAALAMQLQLDEARMALGGLGPPLATLVLVAGSPEAENVMSLPQPPGTRIVDCGMARPP